jgi:hypothetical protein
VERKQSGARLGEAYLFVCAREGGMGWGVGATVRMELTRGWRWGDGLMAAARQGSLRRALGGAGQTVTARMRMPCGTG